MFTGNNLNSHQQKPKKSKCFFLKILFGIMILSTLFLFIFFFFSNIYEGNAYCSNRFSLVSQRKYIDGCLEDGLYGSERSCDEYFRCVKGIPILHFCEKGESWNSKKLSCVKREESDCSQIFVCPEPFGSFKNSLFCDTFYACYYGQAYLIYCPEPLLFSSVSNRCEWPENSDCPETSNTSSTTKLPTTKLPTTKLPTTKLPTTKLTTTKLTTTEPLTTESFITESSTTSFPITESPSTISPTTLPPVLTTTIKPFECVENGYFADPEDCSGYIECKSGVMKKFQCRPGKQFNSKMLSCTAPEISDCGESN